MIATAVLGLEARVLRSRLRAGVWRSSRARRARQTQADDSDPTPHGSSRWSPPSPRCCSPSAPVDEVVGVSSYDTLPAGGVDAAAESARCVDPDFERILSLKPDLVVVYGTQADLIARLDARQHSDVQLSSTPGLPTSRRRSATLGDAGRTRPTRPARARGSIEARPRRRSARRVAGRPRPKTALLFGREPGSAARHLRQRRLSASCTTCSRPPAAPTSSPT